MVPATSAQAPLVPADLARARLVAETSVQAPISAAALVLPRWGHRYRPRLGDGTRSPIPPGRGVGFAPDSPLEGDGFEPSPLCPESSVYAALTPPVAANLHPYSAPFAPLSNP